MTKEKIKKILFNSNQAYYIHTDYYLKISRNEVSYKDQKKIGDAAWHLKWMNYYKEIIKYFQKLLDES